MRPWILVDPDASGFVRILIAVHVRAHWTLTSFDALCLSQHENIPYRINIRLHLRISMNRYGPSESSSVKFARAAPLLVASFLYIIWHLWTRQSVLPADAPDFGSHHASLNRTLGFGGILVAVVPS